jgi:FkbM family methyltransferase
MIKVKLTAYKLKRIIIKFLKRLKIIQWHKDFLYYGHKVFHKNEKDHLRVIRSVFKEYTHSLDFSLQGKLQNDIYKKKGTEFNILDLGAHIGAVSMFYAINFPKARIIAVEPFAPSYNLLIQNLSFHENILPIKALLGIDSKTVELWDNNNLSWAIGAVKASEDSISLGNVNTVTLKFIMAQFTSIDNFILKVDIEGSEKLLFEEIENWDIINSFQIVIVEIHDWMFPGERTAKDIFRWAAFYSREALIKGENIWFFK